MQNSIERKRVCKIPHISTLFTASSNIIWIANPYNKKAIREKKIFTTIKKQYHDSKHGMQLLLRCQLNSFMWISQRQKLHFQSGKNETMLLRVQIELMINMFL